MIELKRLKLINWHNFENVTFDCARLTYMTVSYTHLTLPTTERV